DSALVRQDLWGSSRLRVRTKAVGAKISSSRKVGAILRLETMGTMVRSEREAARPRGPAPRRRPRAATVTAQNRPPSTRLAGRVRAATGARMDGPPTRPTAPLPTIEGRRRAINEAAARAAETTIVQRSGTFAFRIRSTAMALRIA